ncbi:hypothetical protein BJX99DRAFT_233042 [Aspergillus californicus]
MLHHCMRWNLGVSMYLMIGIQIIYVIMHTYKSQPRLNCSSVRRCSDRLELNKSDQACAEHGRHQWHDLENCNSPAIHISIYRSERHNLKQSCNAREAA